MLDPSGFGFGSFPKELPLGLWPSPPGSRKGPQRRITTGCKSCSVPNGSKMASKTLPRRPRWPPRRLRWPQDASKTAKDASRMAEAHARLLEPSSLLPPSYEFHLATLQPQQVRAPCNAREPGKQEQYVCFFPGRRWSHQYPCGKRDELHVWQRICGRPLWHIPTNGALRRACDEVSGGPRSRARGAADGVKIENKN